MRRCESGFAYIWLLLAVAMIGVALARIGVTQAHERQREREQRLLAIGAEFREAIASYHNARQPNAYPRSLGDLLEDRRGEVVAHHLRRIYADPFTAKADWGLVLLNGGIAGVYSRGAGRPLQQADFLPVNAHFAAADSYSNWVFSYPYSLPGSPSAIRP